eukprot:gnl/TRDRNA2_/TRDRNA2_55420_c0_seq1.p1 gnl/TRDRNA2_/TRDRNA2_55420_c0~~gnl/TRDRNA2_/TRDRNA2_55420_c0_seq1.p1  ORF type:complete len:286 (+),score=24.61 gnl/TRDRNA2_/TRDRNA2_55420_c0_seq1:80-859(+)
MDLAALSAEDIELIRQVWLDRHVVFFRGQGHITRRQLYIFAGHFGKNGRAFGESDHDGSPGRAFWTSKSGEKNPFTASNWHADATWQPRPPMGSVLIQRTTPPVGGDTVFADCYAMYEAMLPRIKKVVEGRNAVHGRPVPGSHRSEFLHEVEHPVVRTHPVTRRQVLYVNPTFTVKVCGLPDEESANILAQLYAAMYATPEFQCRFRWQEGSVAFWDNRACQHYGVADSWPHDRNIERCMVLDADESLRAPFFAFTSNL